MCVSSYNITRYYVINDVRLASEHDEAVRNTRSNQLRMRMRMRMRMMCVESKLEVSSLCKELLQDLACVGPEILAAIRV